MDLKDDFARRRHRDAISVSQRQCLVIIQHRVEVLDPDCINRTVQNQPNMLSLHRRCTDSDALVHQWRIWASLPFPYPHSFPFSPFFLCSLPSISLKVKPVNLCCKLFQLGLKSSPSQNPIWCILGLKCSGNNFSYFS